MKKQQKALIVGGFGTIGIAVTAALEAHGFDVCRSSSQERTEDGVLLLDASAGDMKSLAQLPRLDVVVWAHGITGNDSITEFDDDVLDEMLNINVLFIAKMLRALLQLDRLNNNARLCVVSSIWQEQARPNRLSYSISKSAVGGLVRSAAVDLADRGIVINSVMPGVVDTPMAARPGSSAKTFTEWNPHGRIVTAEEVASVVAYLCSPQNTAVSGQSIAVDLGSMTSRIPTS